MLAHVRRAIVSLALLSLITGVIYPAIVTVIAQIALPRQANGSLIERRSEAPERNGKVVGSALIGQPFDDPKYFWGRPSATTPSGRSATWSRPSTSRCARSSSRS